MANLKPPAPDPTETAHHAWNTLPEAFYESEATVSWRDRDGNTQVRLVTGRTILGSAPEATLRIADDPTISRIHAEIDPRRDGVWITDLGSRNGSFLAGAMLVKARVGDGTRVMVGETEIIIRIAASKQETLLYPAPAYGTLVGRSARMRAMYLQLDRIVQSKTTVLIQGETGTGKELVAQVIHDKSPRAGQPFIIVNCGALPEHLLDAELFGHTRGAFTGAVSARTGAFEDADGGTIFLDEIGELPLHLQARMLRVLESSKVRRIGENTERAIDVRFVCATHRDLREMVNQGTFREDLYFRIAVLTVDVPALRERAEDVPLLLAHFLADAAIGEPLDPLKLDALMKLQWRGNVRELRNFARRVETYGLTDAMYASGDRVRGPGATPATAPDELALAGLRIPAGFLHGAYRGARELLLGCFHRQYTAGLKERHGGDRKKMAEEAGIDLSYLSKLIKR